MENRQVQIGKMEKQLKQGGAKLDDLAAKVTTADAKAKADEVALHVTESWYSVGQSTPRAMKTQAGGSRSRARNHHE